MAWVVCCDIDANVISNVSMTSDFSNRFSADKAHVTQENKEAIIDGILLNKEELLNEYKCDLNELVLNYGFSLDFPALLRGPFCGAYWDGSSVCAYGNQTGDTAVFYFFDNTLFVVSPDYNRVVNICRQKGRSLSFDEIYANHLFSLGFSTEGHTVAREIKRVLPGDAIILRGNQVEEIAYYRFSSCPTEITMDEAVERVDTEFRKAVSRCINKDIEYGYSYHLADMSGGLDSRMTTWVAHEMGYLPITNLSYAKQGSFDEQYARMVAKELDNDFIFQPLDNVEFIYDLEAIVHMNYGLAMYAGITGGKKLLSTIDFNKYGLEHTGQIGDVIIGTYCKSESDNSRSASVREIQYGDWIAPILEEKDRYKTNDLLFLYYRAFQGALVTHFIRRHYTEAVSPFLDVDFIQFCLNLPLEYRCEHRLYYRWIETKYPSALSIPTTRIRPGSKKITKKTLYHAMPTWARHAIIGICKKLHLANMISDKKGMNPMDYWYENNSEMRSFIEKYYSEHIDELKSNQTVVETAKTIFARGRTMDKLLVLTVLAANHIYIKNDK